MEMREGSKILQILATDKDYFQNAPEYIILTRSIFQTQSATLQKSNTTFFFLLLPTWLYLVMIMLVYVMY